MMTPTEILTALVQIPSVNPDGDPGTELTGEKACAEWVGDFLRDCGAKKVWFDEVLPDRPNVIAEFFTEGDASDSRPKILFAPHTDTVGVGGMTIDPFAAEIRDGKLWGRGASDTKGTIAGMLWAISQISKRPGGFAEFPVRIGFVGLMGEETGQPGSLHFAEKYRGQWDFAIVGEPTELDVVYCSKGCSWVELRTTGKAAHGATPERGENAIAKMLPIFEALDSDFREELSQFTHPILGQTTMNLGMIRGGTRTNIVPADCVLSVDFRGTPSIHEHSCPVTKLREFLERRGFSEIVELKQTVESTPLDTDPNLDFVQRFTSFGSELVGAPWFCDAARLADGDIPAVAVGPGDIAQAHTEDEFLDLEKLEAGAEFYLAYLDSF